MDNSTILLAEALGTFILIYLGAGVVAGVLLKNSKSYDSGWLVIALAWGLAVSMGIFAVGEISGAHLTPAVTLGFWSIGETTDEEVLFYLLGQFLGAFLGAVAAFMHYFPHWKNTESEDDKLAVFATSPAVRHSASNLLSEMMGTAILLFLILSIGTNEFTEGLNPLVVGLVVVVIGLSLGGTTGYAINPARDLGPRIAHFLLPIPGKRDSDWSYAWIPILGPVLGGIFGALLFRALYFGERDWKIVVCFTIMTSLFSVLFFKKNNKSIQEKSK